MCAGTAGTGISKVTSAGVPGKWHTVTFSWPAEATEMGPADAEMAMIKLTNTAATNSIVPGMARYAFVMVL